MKAAAVILVCAAGGLGPSIIKAVSSFENRSMDGVENRENDGEFCRLHRPVRVEHVLGENWVALDVEAPRMMDVLRNEPAFMQFSHAREIFKDHLVGTFSILAAWGQPTEVARAGLFHTGYSGDLFQFYVWDASKSSERKQLRNIIGADAERLVWLFGTVHRGSVLGLSELISGNITEPPHPLPPAELHSTGSTSGFSTLRVPHRLNGSIEISSEEAAKVMVVTIADYLDQMVEINAWRDHHQVESPLRLYPGHTGPAIALYWMSAICHTIRTHLDTPPPIFDQCRKVLSRENETLARDLYWSVVTGDVDIDIDEQIRRLTLAANHNPWVAEPHVLVAQLYFRKLHYGRAAFHARIALEKFYALAASWDKRLKLNAWVAFTKMLLLRSTRKAEGLSSSLPIREDMPPTSGGMPLASIKELVSIMQT